MKDWKTSLAGLLAVSGQICQAIGLPKELGDAISVIGIFLLGIYAKDSTK